MVARLAKYARTCPGSTGLPSLTRVRQFTVKCPSTPGRRRPSRPQSDLRGSFRVACTVFVPIPDAPAGESKLEPKGRPTLPELLTGAIARNADKQGWARVSAVANYMRQHHGQSAKDHGKATWTKVLRGLPGYEFRNEGTPAWRSASRRASSPTRPGSASDRFRSDPSVGRSCIGHAG